MRWLPLWPSEHRVTSKRQRPSTALTICSPINPRNSPTPSSTDALRSSSVRFLTGVPDWARCLVPRSRRCCATDGAELFLDLSTEPDLPISDVEAAGLTEAEVMRNPTGEPRRDR